MIFFGEKTIFPSAPAPGINNDQSLRIQNREVIQIKKYLLGGSVIDIVKVTRL